MPADCAPLRPLPDRPRVLALEWNLPFHIDMAARLAEQHGWQFVYWVGDGPVFGKSVEARFPGIIFHDTVDARYGRPPPVLANLTPHPFDEELEQALAYEQKLALKMMDRIELEESFSYHERVRLYHQLVAWWSAVLDYIKPDVMIIPTAPHVHYDYVVYALCRRRGIRTAMFENGSVPGILLRTMIFEEGFPDLVAEYRRLLSQGVTEVALPPMLEEYLATTRGTYVKPFGQALYEQIYERKPEPSKPPWHLLGKLGKAVKVWRYPAYFRLVVDELRRAQAPRHVERRVSGHLRGSFIKAGEVDNEADVAHAKWVEERRKQLQLDYEKRITSADFSKPYIYAPLHVQPERSTAPNGGIYDHAELMVEALARAAPPGWLVYVKEHPFQFKPWQVGERGRRLSDYAAMSVPPNVRLLPLDTKPFDLIDNARAVATITGTSGWEAIARGIPVLCFGIAWYQGCDGVFDVRRFDDLKAAVTAIDGGARPDPCRVRMFLKALDRVGFRGFLDIDTQGAAQTTGEENVARLADELAAMVEERQPPTVGRAISLDHTRDFDLWSRR